MTGDLAGRVIGGDRRALARAITLIESDRGDHRAEAAELLDRAAATGRQALRIALSGAPGVGKSTFTESFGAMLTGNGLSVAVLAVDPSSARSGGALLGDKTRMPRLARDPAAFVRPSPSRTSAGGVARRSADTVRLCEAAGFDIVLVETMGVGQSETMAAEMTDLFVLLLAPAGGDDLQGVKRGIMEVADLLLVTKADGALRDAAERTRAEHAAALRLLRRRPCDPEGFPRATAVSALTGEGVAAAWGDMRTLAEARRAAGHWSARRAEQARFWFEAAVRERLLDRLDADPAMRERLAALGSAVAAGETTPARATEEMLAALDAQHRPG